MNTVDCIKSRRSIRRFKPDSVKHSLIEEIVSVASFPHPGKIPRWCGIMWSKTRTSRRRSRRTVCWALTLMPRRSCAATRW